MKKSILATAVLVLAGPFTAVHSQALATLESGGYLLNLTSPAGQTAPSLQFIGGFGTLDFSKVSEIEDYQETGETKYFPGGVGFIEYMGDTLSGTPGAVVAKQYQDDFFGESILYSASWRSQSATAVTLTGNGGNAGQIQSLSLGGGLAMVATRRHSIATGGSVQMSNIRVNLANGEVMADMTGTRFAIGTGSSAQPAVDFNRPNTVVWTAGALTGGPAQIPPDALLAANPVTALETAGLTVLGPRTVTTYQPNTCYSPSGYGYFIPYSCPVAVTTPGFTALRADIQLNDLQLTAEAATFLSDSMGLYTNARNVLTSVNSSEVPGKWGSLTVGAFFRAEDAAGFLPGIPASIPEPSTYALMGLGLLGIWGVSRRAARQPST